jgi:hypothetical protein
MKPPKIMEEDHAERQGLHRVAPTVKEKAL